MVSTTKDEVVVFEMDNLYVLIHGENAGAEKDAGIEEDKGVVKDAGVGGEAYVRVDTGIGEYAGVVVGIFFAPITEDIDEGLPMEEADRLSSAGVVTKSW